MRAPIRVHCVHRPHFKHRWRAKDAGGSRIAAPRTRGETAAPVRMRGICETAIVVELVLTERQFQSHQMCAAGLRGRGRREEQEMKKLERRRAEQQRRDKYRRQRQHGNGGGE